MWGVVTLEYLIPTDVGDPIGIGRTLGERVVASHATYIPLSFCTAAIHSPSLRRRAFLIPQNEEIPDKKRLPITAAS